MRKLLAGIALFVTACSSGVSAPEIGVTDQVCNELFCIDVPLGWQAEIGETYLSFGHELDPTNTFLTVGVSNMQAIVEATGQTWPVSAEETTRAFWSLLEEGGAGTFTRSARRVGGSIKSWGTHSDGVMWFLLTPTEGSSAIGIEMRAPNSSWETHADFVFDSLTTP